MVLRTDSAKSGTRSVQGEMRPGCQIAVGGLAPRAVCAYLLFIVVGVAGCRAAGLGCMLGRGGSRDLVGHVCAVGRRWVGGLCLCFGRCVSLRGLG